MHEHEPQHTNDHHDDSVSQDHWEPRFVLTRPAWVQRLPIWLRPWAGVWVNPIDTYHHVAANVPVRTLGILAALGGVFQALATAASMALGKQLPMPELIGTCVVMGSVVGVAQFLFFSWLFAVTGRWLGGQGTPQSLQPAVGWAAAMSVVMGLIWLPRLWLFGAVFFNGSLTPETMQSWSQTAQTGMSLWMLMELFGTILSFVCYMKMIGQAHGFSAWRALVSLLTAVAVIVTPLAMGMLTVAVFR